MTDYSYISLSVTILHPDGTAEKLISFGQEISTEFSGNPLEMFVNADEAFVFDTSRNQNTVSIWAKNGSNTVTATLGIDKGCKVKPQAIIRLLRECVTLPGLKAEELFEVFGFHTVASPICYPVESKPALHRAMRSFTSTAALVDIVSSRFSGGDREAAIIIAVDATAVPVDEEDTIIRLRTAPVPDFEVDATECANNKPEPEPDPQKSFYTDPKAQSYIEEDEEEYVVKPKKRKKNNPFVIILLIIIALAAGWAAVHFLPALVPTSDYSHIESTDVTAIALNEVQVAEPEPLVIDTVHHEDTIATVTPAIDTVQIAEPSQVQAEQTAKTEETAEQPAKANPDAEKADIDYLNSSSVWKKSQLKSDKYRALFDLFGSGNITDIVNADYFAVPGQCTNRDADKAVTFLWQSYHTDTQHSNVRELKKLAGKNEIDMHALMNNLAKVRSPKPNLNPRPKR